MHRVCTVLLGWLVLCTLLHAHDDEVPCYGLTANPAPCLLKVFKTADLSLNDDYEDYRSFLPPRDRINLARAQRAWRVYRHAACKADYGMKQSKDLYILCMIRLTKLRAQEMQQLYDPGIIDPAAVDTSHPPPPLPPLPTLMYLLPPERRFPCQN